MTRKSVNPATQLAISQLASCKLVPSRHNILTDLPKGGVIAEVGVAFGDFSRAILDIAKPREFFALDLFNLETYSTAFGINIAQKFGGLSHLEYFENRFREEITAGTVKIRKGFSAELLATFPPEFFDAIYIDAAHDYENVKRDLEAAVCAIKFTGTIIMNDFTMSSPFDGQLYGVVQATTEFCAANGWEFSHFALHPLMYCDVAIRRPSSC